MVASMTGFGRDKQTVGDYNITVEIKAVNHRYFEFSSRLPRAYQFLDEKLKSFCRDKIARGKVEISVLIEDCSENSVELEVNRQYADAYIKALHSLAEDYQLKDDITLNSFVGNNDIFVAKRNEADEQVIAEAVLQVASVAIDKFVSMRAKEGERLKNDVFSRIETILKNVDFIENRSPETVREYREKIEQKIKELIGDIQVDEQRLLTETAIFADKIAVAEETVRLRSHINQVVALLEKGGVIGRNIDFIVQEMNREANTIGSKAQDLDIAKTVVDTKSEIEKIREQIQNLE